MSAARLVVLSDGRAYPIEGTLVIGREAECDVVLSGKAVSRRHAEIKQTTRGYVLVDTSSNGTVVNGHPVAGEHVLTGGDVISCGVHALRFEQPGAGPRAAPGARERLSDTLLGMPSVPPPGAHHRLSDTLHGVPAVPPPDSTDQESS